MVGDVVCFLEFNSGKSCFGMEIGHFYIIDQWQLRRVQSHNFQDKFSFEHAYFLKVDSSGIGYFLALFYIRLKRFQKFD